MRWLLLAILVFVSGCVDSSVFGGDVVQTDLKTEEQGAKDVLIIKDIQTIPKSPLLPDQPFTLFFTIENVDDEENAKNVKVDLFNPSLFKDKNGILCSFSSADCYPKPVICSTGCQFLPSEQKQIQFGLKSPTEIEIAGIKLETEMHFSVDYEFTANTFFEVTVVTKREIEQRQRADQSISISGSNVKSSGPIQIEAEIRGAQFVLAGQSANFVFTVKNKGDKNRGNLKNSQIPIGKMTIEFPTNLFDGNSLINPPISFTCSSVPVICTNTGDAINLFKGESIPLKFSISNTKETNIPPFATYPIRAKITDYTYQLRDKTSITIQPFK